MKKALLFLGIFALSIIKTAFGQEFWERIYTLPDSCNRTYDIATNAQGDIFVATDNGLYKTSDYTQSWESVWWSPRRRCTSVDIAPNGRICLGVVDDAKLCISDDNGTSWESIEMYNPGSFEMYYKVKYFGNDTLFVLPRCLGHGAYVEYSFDGGNTWNYQSVGNWNLDYSTDITMAKDRVFYVCLAYFGDKSDDGRPAKGGVFKSHDCVDWEEVEIGNSVESFFVISYSEVLKGVILGNIDNMRDKAPLDDEVLLMPIHGCTFLDDNKVIACGLKTYISFNGGISFVSIEDANGGSRIIAGKDGHLYSVLCTLSGTMLTKSKNPIDDLLQLNDSNEKDGITLSPNPTSGIVRIEGAPVAEIQVYNALGQLVKTARNTNEISLKGQPGGVYLVTVTDKSGRKSVRMLVKE